MRTMSCVWFTVVVLIGVQKVFGNVCLEKEISSFNCDECIRCGGNWCSEKGNVGCNREPEDDWCPYNQERLFRIEKFNEPGDLIRPIYAERSVLVEGTSTIELTYNSKTQLEVKIEIYNSTQSFNFNIREDDTQIKCTNMSCTTSIEATPTYTFCSGSGTNQEFVYAKVTIGNFGQPAWIKYHVACACECSTDVGPPNFCSGHGNYSCGGCVCEDGWNGERCDQESSKYYCSGHGNYSRGGCECEDGWKGERCDQENCPERGDAIPSCKSSINGECSGHGKCNCIDTRDDCGAELCKNLENYVLCNVIYDKNICDEQYNMTDSIVKFSNKTQINGPDWNMAQNCTKRLENESIIFKYKYENGNIVLGIQTEHELPPKANIFTVIESAQKSLEEIFTKRMGELAAQCSAPAKDTVRELAEEFRTFRELMFGMLGLIRKQIEKCSKTVNIIETGRIRKALIFFGVPEVDKENCTESVLGYLGSKLDLQYSSEAKERFRQAMKMKTKCEE